MCLVFSYFYSVKRQTLQTHCHWIKMYGHMWKTVILFLFKYIYLFRKKTKQKINTITYNKHLNK